jgi:hypothetical protein
MISDYKTPTPYSGIWIGRAITIDFQEIYS